MASIVTIPKEKLRDGRPRYKVRWHQSDGRTSNKTFRLKADANAFRTQVENNAQNGVVTNPLRARKLVKDVADEWRRAGEAKGKRPNSLSRDEVICRLHIEPSIGARQIGSVTEDEVQEMVNGWKVTYAPRTVQRHFAVLRAIFAYAVRKKMIPSTPCTPGEIGLPDPDEVDHPVLTGANLEKLAAALGVGESGMMWLGVEGLRWGEAAAMTADRLNLVTGRIVVDRQIDTRGEFAPPKTRKSRRSFAMTQPLADDLTALLAARGLTTESPDLLFPNSRGGALRYSNWRRRTWKPACAKAEFPTLNFHDLRALAATSMLAAGVDVKTAQVRLGHDSITTTADIYARQSPDADRLAAAAIGRLFR